MRLRSLLNLLRRKKKSYEYNKLFLLSETLKRESLLVTKENSLKELELVLERIFKTFFGRKFISNFSSK